MDEWEQDPPDVQRSGLYEPGELEWARDTSAWSSVCYADVDDRVVPVSEYVTVLTRADTFGEHIRSAREVPEILRAACDRAGYDAARCPPLARVLRRACQPPPGPGKPRVVTPAQICECGTAGCATCGVPLTLSEADELERVLVEELQFARAELCPHGFNESDAVHMLVGPLRMVWRPESLTELLVAPAVAQGCSPLTPDDWRARYHRVYYRDPLAALAAVEAIVRRGWVDACGCHPRDALRRRDVEPLLRYGDRGVRAAALAVIGGLARLGVGR